MSMGIAIRIQFTDGKNNIWVLELHALACREWWLSNQKKTKDGMNAKTAASFFLSVRSEVLTSLLAFWERGLRTSCS
jgi:translocation protein SEC63